MDKTQTPPVLRIESLTKQYRVNEKNVSILHDVSLTVEKGSFTAIMGPSGSGKSTLMQCAAGLDTPTTGKVWLGHTDIGTLDENALNVVRRKRIGFVFQAFNLLPMLTAIENIALPLRLNKTQVERSQIAAALRQVGLENKGRHLPSELSGGEQQRVAIARTLIAQPEVIFADEPTGALDTLNSQQVLTLLRSAVDAHNQSVVMVTHDLVAASWADRVIFLVDGTIRKTLQKPTVEQIAHEISQWSAPSDRA